MKLRAHRRVVGVRLRLARSRTPPRPVRSVPVFLNKSTRPAWPVKLRARRQARQESASASLLRNDWLPSAIRNHQPYSARCARVGCQSVRCYFHGAIGSLSGLNASLSFSPAAYLFATRTGTGIDSGFSIDPVAVNQSLSFSWSDRFIVGPECEPLVQPGCLLVRHANWSIDCSDEGSHISGLDPLVRPLSTIAFTFRDRFARAHLVHSDSVRRPRLAERVIH